jgi:hypothetical protein
MTEDQRPRYLLEVECFVPYPENPAQGGAHVIYEVSVFAPNPEAARWAVFPVPSGPALSFRQVETPVRYTFIWPLRVRVRSRHHRGKSITFTRTRWTELQGEPPQDWLDARQQMVDDYRAEQSREYAILGIHR